MASVSNRFFADRLMPLFRQGLSPEKLALAVALGAALSCFPVLGTTTILCTIVALVFRLNLPAIQIGNFLALPLQLALFIPFLRLGERITGAPRLLLSPEQLLSMARTSPNETMQLLLAGQWHAILGWLLIAPGLTLLLTLFLRPALRVLQARAGATHQRPETFTVRIP